MGKEVVSPLRQRIGAFRPPAVGVRGETVIPAAENLLITGSSLLSETLSA